MRGAGFRGNETARRGAHALGLLALLLFMLAGTRRATAGDDGGDSATDSVAEPSSETTSPPSTIHWPRLASGPLQDNSFFIEEAYNQEAGVVQSIWNGLYAPKTGNWAVTFTQEWPAPDEENQISYTIPFGVGGDEKETGVGDMLLNYRRQVLEEDETWPAFAPRLSLILPTGDPERLGNGAAGLQVMLPFSKQINQHWEANLNAGAGMIPGARGAEDDGHSEFLVTWVAGASVIWEPVDAVNVLAEFFATQNEAVVPAGIEDTVLVLISPGIRTGWNLPLGVQLVIGAAMPIGLTRDTPDLSAFVYFSIENPFTADALAKRRW